MGRYHAHASDITESADAPEILRAVLLNSGFAASLFEGLRPARMTTSELEALIGDMGYRLLRIENSRTPITHQRGHNQHDKCAHL
jgi:hypothetical protein